MNSDGVPMVLLIHAIVAVLAFAFTAGKIKPPPLRYFNELTADSLAVLPVFWFTSIPLGGFGFAPEMISRLFALAGVAQALWLLVIFPFLHRRIGTGGVFRVCAAVWPFMFAANPLENLILKRGWDSAFWCTYLVVLVLGSGCAMAFSQ
jgi:hypothetical protein